MNRVVVTRVVVGIAMLVATIATVAGPAAASEGRLVITTPFAGDNNGRGVVAWRAVCEVDDNGIVHARLKRAAIREVGETLVYRMRVRVGAAIPETAGSFRIDGVSHEFINLGQPLGTLDTPNSGDENYGRVIGPFDYVEHAKVEGEIFVAQYTWYRLPRHGGPVVRHIQVADCE